MVLFYEGNDLDNNLLHLAEVADQPEAIAFLSSCRCTNEENYLANKFTRAVLKTNNIDHCARL